MFLGTIKVLIEYFLGFSQEFFRVILAEFWEYLGFVCNVCK